MNRKLIPIKVSTVEATRQDMEALLEVVALAERPNYFRRVVLHRWLDGQLPTAHTLKKWMRNDHYPHGWKVWTTIRRLFALNGQGVSFHGLVTVGGRHPVNEVGGFPFATDVKLTQEQIDWVSSTLTGNPKIGFDRRMADLKVNK